jgi:hypothetical protein
MWHVLKSFQSTQIQCIYVTLECQCVNKSVQDPDKICDLKVLHIMFSGSKEYLHGRVVWLVAQ